MIFSTKSGSSKADGREPKTCFGPSCQLYVRLFWLSTWMHAHVYSCKLGPGLVLLAKVCPWQNLSHPVPVVGCEASILGLWVECSTTVLLRYNLVDKLLTSFKISPTFFLLKMFGRCESLNSWPVANFIKLFWAWFTPFCVNLPRLWWKKFYEIASRGRTIEYFGQSYKNKCRSNLLPFETKSPKYFFIEFIVEW